MKRVTSAVGLLIWFQLIYWLTQVGVWTAFSAWINWSTGSYVGG